ncbi:DpnD/PcfM family protein [Lacrimispora sp. 38-1]|uniref:DpnD/PcfM family protein n=1 Tax=Lacrimispora sp. 38-1 TaxID=3125778 RepID=UPI003CF68564
MAEQEFHIEIKELLSRVETVKAETLSEAIEIVMDRYYAQEIVLDAEDFKGIDFELEPDTQIKEKIR